MSQNINLSQFTRLYESEERIQKYINEYRALEEKAKGNGEKQLATMYGGIWRGLELALVCIR